MKIMGWDVSTKDRFGATGMFFHRVQEGSEDYAGIWFDRGLLLVYGYDLFEGAPYDVFFHIRFFCFDIPSRWYKVKINAGWFGKHWGWGIPWNRKNNFAGKNEHNDKSEKAQALAR